MNRHSSTTDSLLDLLEGRARGAEPVSSSMRWTPRIRKLHDPREDVEDVVKLLDAGEVPEVQPSRLMQALRNRSQLGETESGVVHFESRPCCAQTILDLQTRMHLLKLPYQFVCVTCATTFELGWELR